jgi:hypothetical protein
VQLLEWRASICPGAPELPGFPAQGFLEFGVPLEERVLHLTPDILGDPFGKLKHLPEDLTFSSLREKSRDLHL